MFTKSPGEKSEAQRESSNSLVNEPKTGPGATASDSAGGGLTIEDYSKTFSLTEAEIWRRLRRGELVGRSQKGHLIIYKSLDSAPPESPADDLPASPLAGDLVDGEDLSALPPLPPPSGVDLGASSHRPGATAGGNFLSLSATGERGSSPELALLLDHLSLAKEENREILRMTQESIRKVSELSDTVVEMKDSVIESKEAQIMALREQLAARDHELRKLRQQNEDLEMLSRAIASEKKKK